MESRQIPPAQASARQTELGASFDRVLFAALDALEERQIPYCIIGGIAASGLGRPRSTHDIDFFVRPEDAEATLEALAHKGFDTERTDERWLFKGWKEQMMVDIIFKSEGDIYFDDEMERRTRPLEYHGRIVPAVAPEDLIIIKCAVHSENGPHHWHDALAVLSHATMDWQYLLRRARRAARRLLALLIYAQSNDIWIPNGVISELFNSIFGENPTMAGAVPPEAAKRVEEARSRSDTALRAGTRAAASEPTPFASGPSAPTSAVSHMASGPGGEPDAYFIQKVREAIATDSRAAALDIRVFVSGRTLTARGEVQTEAQREAIENVISENAPGFDIDNQVRCCHLTAPKGAEEVV